MFTILLISALALAVAGDAYDVVTTEKCIKKLGDIETNDWLVGSRPTLKALCLRDALVLGIATAPCALFAAYGFTPWQYAGLIAPVIFGIKHYLGGRAGAKLLQ